MSWLTEMITTVLADIVNAVIEFFFSFIQGVFDSAELLIKDNYVITATSITMSIALVFVLFIAVKHILDTYILETNGDSDTDPLQVLVNCSISVAMITTNNLILSKLLEYASNLSKRVTQDIDVEYDGLYNALKALVDAQNPVKMIIVSIYVIMMISFVFRACMRGIELALMKVLFPIFSCDYCSQGRERWNGFFSSYMVVIFGYIIQLFAFRMSVVNYVSGELIKQFIGFGFLWMAIKTPKWLEKFAYKSGVGQTASGGARNAAFVLPRFIGK